MGQLLIGFLLFSALPIWRGAGHSRHDGINLWRLMGESFDTVHIKYDDAVVLAHQAYLEHLAQVS